MIIAKILKPQGIKGEVKAELYIEDLKNFKNIKSVHIEGVQFTIKNYSFRDGFLYLEFNEITSRNDAENLRDKKISVEKDELLPLSEGKYYVDDLIGCKIIDEDKNEIGKIKDVNNYGATDILTIRDGSEEILCPFLGDVFVSVNIKEKTIVVSRKRFLEVTQSED
ncbi:MAG: 16S rRNA processing protein RimM [Clostridia bacterium]|nr:16S rRNA processing protein RimM [Clostridia bacterium]